MLNGANLMGLQFFSFSKIIENEFSKNPKRILLISNLSLFLHRSELKKLRSTPLFKKKDYLSGYKFGDYAIKYLNNIFPESTIDILDYSNYENANVIADLNSDLTITLTSSYDLIIEGGTLEHVFNFPQAISNINNLLKIGGTLYFCTPANNQCGHGFYQFSPELFYRLYNEKNGFKLNMIKLFGASFPSVELTKNKYLATPLDASSTGIRTQFMSSIPVMMVISATKLSVMKTEIQQSDYELKWNSVYETKSKTSLKNFIKTYLPIEIVNRLKGLYEKKLYSIRNKKIFIKT